MVGGLCLATVQLFILSQAYPTRSNPFYLGAEGGLVRDNLARMARRLG